MFLTLQKLIPLKCLRQAFKVDKRFEKLLKQLFLLQCPLGISWDALVIHFFLVVITFLRLLYFLALTGVQR